MSTPQRSPLPKSPRSRLHAGKLFALCLSVLLTAGWFTLSPAFASSVARVTLTNLVAHSEFIFEGKVRHIESHQEANGRLIWTRISFDVVDVVKGQGESDLVVLEFLGGTYNGKTLQVSDMILPDVEERGVYFVETRSRRQVHPLYGWAQGHFVVVQGQDGTDRVTTVGANPVLDLEPSNQAKNPKTLSTGVAQGVVIRRATALSKAMSLSDFKRRISQLITSP